jgi:uncharacterized membrane protein (Fun14 family)
MYIHGYTQTGRIGMNIENIYSIAVTSSGGFFVSFLIGYFIKKVIRILMFVLGGILTVLMYLQFQEIIHVKINLDKFQSSAEDLVNAVMTNASAIFSNDNSQPFSESNLGIPVNGIITAGFVLGITRRG